MKRSAFASLAILALLISFAGPVSANGVAQGKQLTVVLQGLPDTCPTNASMSGELLLQLADNGTVGKRLVAIDVSVDTPFGDVNVFHATVRMAAGSKREIPLRIPVGANVPTGTYTFHVTVSVKGESLAVAHEVYIYNGK